MPVLAYDEKALVLLDEHEAREQAKALGLKITGTVGCLLIAKKEGHIKAVKPCLEVMKKTSSFRIADNLYQAILDKAEE